MPGHAANHTSIDLPLLRTLDQFTPNLFLSCLNTNEELKERERDDLRAHNIAASERVEENVIENYQDCDY